jgi:transposase
MRGNLGLLVSGADRARLAAIVADRSSPQKHVWRARVVLLSADRVGTAEIMRRTGLSKPSVWRWQERYIEAGVEGLLRDKTRPSRVPALAEAKVAEVIQRTLDEPPPDEATHWTVRAMAAMSGVSPAKVHQIWQAAGLAPHRYRRFKLSDDPAFAEKVEDVVGLYVAPPKHAIVLSLDEKSQIQALDRTQPGLPMKPARLGTMTHDDKRNGTTTLFAALDVLEGTVIGQCMQRHRNQEFIRFLNAIERQVPGGLVIHVILDNYAAHKHPNVRQWLARHPRWIFPFTPTSCSWLNAVEGFFAKLTKRRLTWKADPKAIIAAAKRGHQTLQTIH